MSQRSSVAALVAAVLSLASAADAQRPPIDGDAVPDSARVAREAYARAAKALGAGDLADARREIARAATAWPMQPAYAWGRAVLAVQAGDTNDVRDALAAFAALGVGRDVRGDRRFAAYVDRADIAPIVARLDAARAPVARSRVWATLADTTLWPEGVDHDARTNRFYIASVQHGTVVEISANGDSARDVWRRDDRTMGAVLGVRVDAGRGVLWATVSPPQAAPRAAADSQLAALVRVRLEDGAIERRWDLPPVAGGHVLGDLAVGPNGDVWVTDSQSPWLYRLRPGRDSLERTTHPLFNSLQGVAPTPDGRTLYLADYSHGLLRMDVATGAITRLADAPGSTSIGCDGIAWDRGAIVAVQNGVAPARVMRFVLDARGTRIARADVIDQNVAIADQPTIGTIVGRTFVYVANSAWDQHDDQGKLRDGARIARPVLLGAPLP